MAVGEKPGEDQIRDSNNYTIGATRNWRAEVERLPLAGDDTKLLKQQIVAAAEHADR